MKTSQTSRVPRTPRKHQEITNRLRDLAASLTPGDRFPSQNELMQQFAVSDRTVLRSLDDLRRDGWIVRRNGIGTFVADDRPRFNPAPVGDNGTLPKTGTLAVLALARNQFFQRCVDELTTQATAAGLRVICHFCDHKPDFDSAFALEALQPSGYLIFSHGLIEVATTLQARGHVVVLVGSPPAGVLPSLPCVHGDQEYGAFLAAQSLFSQNHRRIAYAYRMQPDSTFHESRRYQGFCRAVRSAGYDPDSMPRFGNSQYHAFSRDPEQTRRAFTGPDAPTGLCVWTDEEAVKWLSLLRQADLSVPGDVSMIGYDNLESMSAHSQPPLHSVEPYIAVQIQHALGLLNRATLEQFAEKTTTASVPFITVTPTLVVRESCAPPVHLLPGV